jgi:hypothetical protein
VAISVSDPSGKVRLTGQARDPFTQQKLATVASAPSAAGAAVTGTSVSAGAGVSVAGSSLSSNARDATVGTGSSNRGVSSTPSSGATGGGGTSTVAPAEIVPPGAKPTPAPNGLTATQSYDVALSITNTSGGVNTIDPLARDSLLPSDQQPLVIELGVLQGGNRVFFAVQPGTSVNGPGTCTPGPIDCEILSLAQDQTESVSGGGVSTSFAVTGITAEQHSSVAAANQARRAVSPAGSKLLSQSTLSALSLFQYQPSVGAVVDLRNLTVGGN